MTKFENVDMLLPVIFERKELNSKPSERNFLLKFNPGFGTDCGFSSDHNFNSLDPQLILILSVDHAVVPFK